MAELALAIAGLAVGLPAVVEGTQKLGQNLVDRIRHIEDGYKGLYDLVLQINQSQTGEMMSYFFNSEASIPETLEAELLGLLQKLRSIYEDLLAIFPIPKEGKKTKLSVYKSKKADAGLVRLEEWNEKFFKRAIVFTLFGQRPQPQQKSDQEAEPDTGNALKGAERLREAVKESLDRTKSHSEKLLIQNPEHFDFELLPHSNIYRCQPKDPQSEAFLAEFRLYSDNEPEREVQNHRKIVREVAGVLRHADPKVMGLLCCHGFTWKSLDNRFELLLNYPQGLSEPRTLLDLLMQPETRRDGAKHPLNHRIDLARKIISALFVLHSADLVHKQVRPENILIFERRLDASLLASEQKRQSYPYSLGVPFLVGFDAVRKVDASSQMLHVEEWQKNIYLSPQRHRLQPGDEYKMQHDLYSIGVVLLEIAFWASFQDKHSPILGSRIWKDNKIRAPEELKKLYLSLASGAVSRMMGQRYADVVTACLNGLEDNARDGSLEDEDGIVIGTAYVTEVIKGLEDIRL